MDSVVLREGMRKLEPRWKYYQSRVYRISDKFLYLKSGIWKWGILASLKKIINFGANKCSVIAEGALYYCAIQDIWCWKRYIRCPLPPHPALRPCPMQVAVQVEEEVSVIYINWVQVSSFEVSVKCYIDLYPGFTGVTFLSWYYTVAFEQWWWEVPELGRLWMLQFLGCCHFPPPWGKGESLSTSFNFFSQQAETLMWLGSLVHSSGHILPMGQVRSQKWSSL